MTDKYKVVRYIGDRWEYALENAEAREAVLKAKEITDSPGALIGSITRVMITDPDDFCAFDWKFGEGVVFPKKGA